jgi:hypothetical protein
MPWKECSVMDERVQFVARRLAGEPTADLARSRANPRVQPESLIPERPTHVRFRHSSFGVEDEIVRVFQMLDGIFGQIW